MGQVAINVNGRSYRFDCGDGEEARLKELAADVKGRIETLAGEYGSVGDERLMLMTALLITDELWDARALLKEALLKEAGLEAALKEVPLNEKEPVNGHAGAEAEAAAEIREPDAIRTEYRRKLAAGGDA